MLKRRLAAAAVAVIVLFVAVPLAASSNEDERRTVTKTYPFTDREVPVGIRVDEATIESFKIRDWPNHEQVEKGEKDHGDTHSMNVEFTYSNRDDRHDYKCKYRITVLSDDDKPYGENDKEVTLDKGKNHDTHKVSVRMKTHHFREAKFVRITFHVKEKD